MAEPTTAKVSVVHDTFVLESHLPAPLERAFAAFADPVKKRRWFVEGEGHKVEQYEMDFRVGGKERASFQFAAPGTPVDGMTCVNEGSYQDIEPNRRVVLASSMTIGGRRISASLVTAEFLPSEAGTLLILTHQGAFFEGADGPEMRQGGWRKLLERLSGELRDHA